MKWQKQERPHVCTMSVQESVKKAEKPSTMVIASVAVNTRRVLVYGM